MGLFSKDEPVEVETRTGKLLVCSVCGGTRFFRREAMLNTPGLTFLDLEWANRTAECRVCSDCGHIHWFLE